jgi:hypothetical protein
MHAKIVTFAAGALFVLGNAVPLNNGKRDLVWVTEIATAVETVPVTTTVWVDPTGAPEYHGHGHRSKHNKQSQSPQSSAVEVKPTPSAESSSSIISVEQAAYSAPAYEAPSSVAEPTTESTTEAAPSTTAQAQQTTTSTTPEPAPATTEAYVAPVSSYVAPVVSSYEAPSSTYVAPSSTYEAPVASSAAPASYGGSSGSDSSNPASGKTFSGEITYFTPGMGACGETSGEGDKMVAISMALFDQYTPNGNPNKNPLCGKTLTIKGADGAEHKATIWDRCVGCAMDDLDMPQEFFNEVTTPSGSSTPADGRAYGYEWSMN